VTSAESIAAVTPANAGVPLLAVSAAHERDSRVRGNDGVGSGWRNLPGVFALLCASPAFAEQPNPEADIRTVIADMQAAWNRGDFEGYMRGFRNPGVVFVSRGQFQDDWQGTLDHYVRDYGGEPERRGTLHFYDIEVEMLAPDAAQLISRYHLDRADSPQYGINTRLMRRVGGRWVIALNHVSSTEAPDPNDPVEAHRQ
jgi:ketosteroid isomerase-like protein